MATETYVSSTNINVYPTGFRGYPSGSTTTVYDPESMLNTEDNLTRPYLVLADFNGIIQSTVLNNNSFEFVLGGYYFKIKGILTSLGELDDSSTEAYANILITPKGTSGDTTNTAYVANSLTPISDTTKDCLDNDSVKFIGLKISNAADSTATYSMIIAKKVSGSWVINDQRQFKYTTAHIAGGKDYAAESYKKLSDQLDTALVYGRDELGNGTLTLQGQKQVLLSACNGELADKTNSINLNADLSEIDIDASSAVSVKSANIVNSSPDDAQVVQTNLEYNLAANVAKYSIRATGKNTLSLNNGSGINIYSADDAGITLNYNDITEAVLDKSGAKVTYNSDETYLELNSVGATLKANTRDINILAASGTITNSAKNISIAGSNGVYLSGLSGSGSYIDLDNTTHNVMVLGAAAADKSTDCEIKLDGSSASNEGIYLTVHDDGIIVDNTSIYANTGGYNLGTSSNYFNNGYITTLNSTAVKTTAVNASTVEVGSHIILDGTGNKITAGSFYATSDRRLKENIKEFSYTKSILELPVKEFNFIGQSKKQIGCIAQDLQELYPELVETDEKGYLSIAENKLVYLLLEEVKELKKEITELKNSKK